MDAEQTNIAKACLTGAQGGSLSFPQIVGRLMTAGFEGYLVDYRSAQQTFYLAAGGSLTLPMGHLAGTMAAAFDAGRVAELVRWAQGNGADYSYAGFCARVMAAGCAGYIVSFPGRRVVYFGRTAETHVEHFPA